MDYTEIKIKTINKYSGIIVEVGVDKITLPNGKQALREVVEHPGGVAILALDENGCAICVHQYRYCFGEHLLEIPAGKLEYGEQPYECAVRELSEETGITAKKVVSLGEIYSSPGYSREVLYLYLATELSYGCPHLDDGEFLDVIRVPFDELVRDVLSGKIKDAKTVAAVLKTKLSMEGES